MMRALILAAVLALAGCAGTDIRAQHLAACEAYTDALTSAAVWKDLGAFDPEQLTALRRVEATTTPLCLGEPSADGLSLVLKATDSLEALLLSIVLQAEGTRT